MRNCCTNTDRDLDWNYLAMSLGHITAEWTALLCYNRCAHLCLHVLTVFPGNFSTNFLCCVHVSILDDILAMLLSYIMARIIIVVVRSLPSLDPFIA